MSGYYGVAMDTRGALDVPGQARCQFTMELLCNPSSVSTNQRYIMNNDELQSEIVTSQAKG